VKAVEWFVKGLQERGVDWISTLCGHGLDPLDFAAEKAGLRLVDTRNEQAAAYMAEVHGRLTRRPGVAAVSSGIGHTNAMTGVLSAHFDGAPMILVSGSASHTTATMGHFQDVDQVALAAPATKYARVIDQAERTLQILDEAWQAAVSLPPGPVHLTFPMDIQNTEVAEQDLIRPARSLATTIDAGEHIDDAAQLLAHAERPLIVAGSGIYYAGEGEALVEFAEQFSVPVQVPIWDRGCVEVPSESFIGVLGSATGGPALLQQADLIIMAGAAPDYRVGFLQAGAVDESARVIQVNLGWGDFAEAYEDAGGKEHRDWLSAAQRLRDEFRESVQRRGVEQAGDRLHAMDVIEALRPALSHDEVFPGDAIFLIDGGSIGQWAHQLLSDRYPGHWLTCGRSGVVGWGLPGAMAARLVYPDRPVILLSGDGSFTFTPAEIECAVRQGLPFVVIVADDQSWGITKTGHVRDFGKAVTSSLGPIDFVKLAEAFGARGVRAESPEEISRALDEALGESTVTVIHVPIVGGNPAQRTLSPDSLARVPCRVACLDHVAALKYWA